MNKSWWKEAVVYQIYPRSFLDTDSDGIGDLRGILGKLDYLQSLGVTAVWLCPIYPSPNVDNGYDISDYKAIAPEFGTMADFELLLSEMHRHGLRLIMDMVFNHTSDQHPWFQQAIRDPASPYRNYYFFRDGQNGGPPNNWASHFSFSAWEKEPRGEQYYLHLYATEQPDLNWDCPAVREEVFSVLNFWKQKGVDGFRLDVINDVSKTPGLPAMPGEGLQLAAPYFANGPRMHEYLREMNRRLLEGTELMTVGEMVFVTPEQARIYTAEDSHELNMIFHFEHMGLDCVGGDKWKPRPWTLSEFKQCFGKWQEALAREGWNSLYLNNHDQPRMVSRFGSEKFRGQSAKLLCTFLLTLRGTPFLFQGEELGMTNAHWNRIAEYRDVDTLNHYKDVMQTGEQGEAELMAVIAARSRDNARTPMQWNAGFNAGFTTGAPWIGLNPNYLQINAEAEERDEASVLSYYRQMIRLRKAEPVLIYGDYRPLRIEHPQVYAYLREWNTQRILVLLNFSADAAEICLPDTVLANTAADLLIGNGAVSTLERIQPLTSYEAQVWRLS